jgi:hypothetical protein
MMANDRMFLRNKITGTRVMIAKHYCDNWYIPREDTLVEQLKDFFSENQEAFIKSHHSYEIEYEFSKDLCPCKDIE